MNWITTLIRENFDKFFLLSLFFGGATLLVWYPDNERLAQWVQGGAVIGAMLMLITGNKKTAPSPDGPTTGKVTTTIHTEEETK